MLTLRPYQEELLNAVSIARAQGLNRVLVKAPTGTGKTQCFAQFLKWPQIRSWLEGLPTKTGATMLVVAHREELLEQARATIQRENPGLMVSIEQGDLYANRYSDVVVASIQTLSARKFTRLKRLMERHSFRIVVVDEAHHAAASTYRTALAHLGFLPAKDLSDKDNIEAATHDDVDVMTRALEGWDQQAPKDRLLVGVTATPNRSDAIGLACVFQTLAYSYALKEAIADGWLVPIVPWVVETTTSLDAVRTSHGDFNQRDLADTVNTPARNRLAVAAWREHALGRSTLAFTVDVQHAHDLATAFAEAGVSARAISGETPKDERRGLLAAYLRGDVTVLTNCMVFSEGTDLPLTGCILMAKPTKSATLYEQCVGRGLRTFPDKSECILLDIVDVARKHSLQAAPVLYGLPPGIKTAGKDLRAVSDELDALREQYPNLDVDGELAKGHLTLEQLGALASTFSVWDIPSLGELASVVTMNWIRVGTDTFRLQYPWADGTEVLSVQPDVMGHYDLSLTLRPSQQRGLTPAPVRQRTIASQVPSVTAALGLAEAFVQQERRTVMRLKDREAPWRARPASPKQIGYLMKLRVPFNPKTLTMGEASDRIDLAHSKRSR